MYIQTINNTRKDDSIKENIYLFESYRDHGKQKRKIIANLSNFPKDMLEQITELVYNRNKGVMSFSKSMRLTQGKSFGGFLAFSNIAEKIGLKSILGNDKNGQLAMLQIIARITNQKSRLHIANFFPSHYALEETLGINYHFDEDDLYVNLDWLVAHQSEIEDKLFKQREKLTGEEPDAIYLYDVTGSYTFIVDEEKQKRKDKKDQDTDYQIQRLSQGTSKRKNRDTNQ